MQQSEVHLLDLPDELLLTILKKLDNIDVLYSLLDEKNDRLDVIARDRIFARYLTLPLSNGTIRNRFCDHILFRIHHNVQQLAFESSLINRVLSAGNYPQLTHLKLSPFDWKVHVQSLQDLSQWANINEHITNLTLVYNDTDNFISVCNDYTTNVYARTLAFFRNLQQLHVYGSSITASPSLSLVDLPSTTFSSSTLTKLTINSSTFTDCLHLLDGRLSRLNTLMIRVYDMSSSTMIPQNQDSLLRLKHFSLTCHSHIRTYDTQVVPLLHGMCNLEALNLSLTVQTGSGLIDGIHVQNEILAYMPLLDIFTFDIRTWNTFESDVQPLSKEDIQRTFIDIGYRHIGCSIRYFSADKALCHVFTLPFTSDYLQCVTNDFPSVSFSSVLYLSVCDVLPFEHEFFSRLSKAFPSLKHLTVTNAAPQTCQASEEGDTRRPLPAIEYKHLVYLSVMNSDITYTEQFLLETKTQLPCLTKLRVSYEQLKNVTENFTRKTTRLSCCKVKQLIIEVPPVLTDHFSLYFPSLETLS